MGLGLFFQQQRLANGRSLANEADNQCDGVGESQIGDKKGEADVEMGEQWITAAAGLLLLLFLFYEYMQCDK
jgi:hypothetical protein